MARNKDIMAQMERSLKRKLSQEKIDHLNLLVSVK
jgi:hypothetical protein